MNKSSLAKVALIALLASSVTVVAAPEKTQLKVNASDSSANGQDHYVCLKYNNCGKCNGKCVPRNPQTPGLTPEEKKEAEENQKNNDANKGKGAHFCGAGGPKTDYGNTLSSHQGMLKKRANLV